MLVEVQKSFADRDRERSQGIPEPYQRIVDLIEVNRRKLLVQQIDQARKSLSQKSFYYG